ncbi:sensor histidine kinase [Nocardia takedensis]|uniref:sensor histidine kinase n=1 Tax=Nocardia takedensis TaxID=259390 RepID=UPI001FE08036|nr:sensor histidine kinase [Nocardia takedensis]
MVSRAGVPLVRRLTVQAWLQLVMGVMVGLVLLGAAVGARAIETTKDRTGELINAIQPAVSEAYRLQAAWIDQETGARGYAITGDPSFLEPYRSGRDQEQRSTRRLRELLGGRTELTADLDALAEAGARWREVYAEPLVTAPDPAAGLGARLRSRESSDNGKAAFDALRARFDTQNRHLEQARVDTRAEVMHSRDTRNAVLAGSVLLFLLTMVVLTVVLRRLVAAPLRGLENASRRVADGDLDHHIPVNGPADLATVAEAVESMRERVVTDLAGSRAAEAELSRQAARLDAQTEELRRSNLELEQFAYVASHDLQEPLRKVASFCQLLAKRYGDRLDDRGRQYINYAVDGAKRMQILINYLLAFSRVGRAEPLTPAPAMTLTTALDTALTALSTIVEESGAQIRRPASLPDFQGEATLLTMLWQNLIGNALKFTRPDQTPVITIATTTIPDPPDGGDPVDIDGGAEGFALITVSDNGIGISSEYAEKVFVIFQRLHNRSEFEGTGIGLAICRKIVDHYGGRIWIDTDYTDGARFCFTLPVR